MNKKTIGFALIVCITAIILITTTKTDHPGEVLYLQNCANCHMEDGSGLDGLIPPLNSAAILADYKEDLVSIVINGLSGEIVVDGVRYDEVMPPLNKELHPIDVTNLLNYVLKEFANNDLGRFTVKEVGEKLGK